MNREALIQFCRKLPHATEDVKWGSNHVFSIGGKMFAVFDLNDDVSVSFKAAPATFDLLTTKSSA
ncbi:MAG: MmcQ/YjbR family DNA-binding protein [candidate division KSB1 bacterium]